VKATRQPLTDSIAHGAHVEGVGYTMALDNEQEAIIHCCTYREQEQVSGITWLGVIVDNINSGFRLITDFPLQCVALKEKMETERKGIFSRACEVSEWLQALQEDDV
jgi:hypothetical protein